jgi:hypothetical protein
LFWKAISPAGAGKVEVGHRQELSPPVREPLRARQPLALRAMAIATGVVGDPDRAAVVALLDMAAECRRPARRDGAHHAALDATEMTGMRLPKRFAVVAEDIRHLHRRSHGVGSTRRHDLQPEPVERAHLSFPMPKLGCDNGPRFGSLPRVGGPACSITPPTLVT